ncbi:MAG: glycosyltransferase family 2 protein [Candidatus Baltobacteraceae bacterium]
MSEVFAFGESALKQQHFYTAREHPVLIVAPDGAVQAIQKAVELRTAGRNFDAALILREQTTVQAVTLGKELLRFSQDFDQRRNAYELLSRNQLEFGGKKQAEIGALTAPIAKTLSDIAALADRWLVRSWREYRRNVSLLGLSRNAFREVVLDTTIPDVRPDPNADAIVVWAPDEVPESIAVVLFGLEEFRRPSYVVCRPGPMYGLKTILVPPEDARRALLRAQVVVDAAVDGPSAALTFLSRGIRTVASRTTGAPEYAAQIRTYEPSVRRSIFAAISVALGEGVSALHVPTARPEFSKPATVEDAAPTVSLIVRTHNRPQFLRRALQSIEAQTYPNTETVVINNGGDAGAITAICAAFPRARLTTIEQTDIASAATRGLEEARGKYAGLLDDDDALFADHVRRLCDALVLSGARAAYADALNVYVRTVSRSYALSGYCGIFVPALERTSMLSVCQVVGSCRMMFDRGYLLSSGGFLPEFFPADDYEAWLRLIESSDVIRVAAVTSMYTQFLDRSNTSIARGPAYVGAHKAVYNAHPTTRQAVLQQRERLLASIRQRGGLGMAPPAVIFDPQPLLF